MRAVHAVNALSDDEVEETITSTVEHPDNGEHCHFGHRTTTTRVRGKSVWNRNPACSWWPGRVPGLVTLCNKCFQIGRRHFLKGNKAPLPSTAVGDTSVVHASQKGQITNSEATATLSDTCEMAIDAATDHPHKLRRLDHSSKEVAIPRSQAAAATYQ